MQQELHTAIDWDTNTVEDATSTSPCYAYTYGTELRHTHTNTPTQHNKGRCHLPSALKCCLLTSAVQNLYILYVIRVCVCVCVWEFNNCKVCVFRTVLCSEELKALKKGETFLKSEQTKKESIVENNLNCRRLYILYTYIIFACVNHIWVL